MRLSVSELTGQCLSELTEYREKRENRFAVQLILIECLLVLASTTGDYTWGRRRQALRVRNPKAGLGKPRVHRRERQAMRWER